MDDLSLQVRAGELVCLVGPSGCGKSTLINILGCLDRPTAGRYRFAGVDVAGLDNDRRAAIRREEIGLVSQAGNLLERRSARENVALPATYTAMDAVHRRQRADNLLRSLGLAARREHKPTELSGGERQRIALARALMNEPRVVLADEPTGALDTNQQAVLLKLFADLAQRGHAVLIASHDATRRDAQRTHQVRYWSGRYRAVANPTARRTTRRGEIVDGLARAARAAVGSLLTTPLCSTLSVLSVGLGVGCMTSVLGVAEGAYEATRQFIGRLGADRISISGLSVVLTSRDADAISHEVPHIRATVPALFGSYDIQYQDRRVDAEVSAERGVEVPEFMYEPYPVERGILLSQRDQDRGDPVIVIGPKLRQGLFAPDRDPIGETALVGGARAGQSHSRRRHGIPSARPRSWEACRFRSRRCWHRLPSDMGQPTPPPQCEKYGRRGCLSGPLPMCCFPRMPGYRSMHTWTTHHTPRPPRVTFGICSSGAMGKMASAS
ncbi:MAG: ATP-binding cassette domain-containing protein [Gammaproteobacteria bacterium]|nr:ATP-binding cassette domain-containing protein [Gammaproteobacteria bacterium]